MMLLLLFYSFSPKVMVGTDIVHAVHINRCDQLPAFQLGNIDPYLVGSLLIGSIPGGLLGSHLSTRLASTLVAAAFCAVLLATGARMLWA